MDDPALKLRKNPYGVSRIRLSALSRKPNYDTLRNPHNARDSRLKENTIKWARAIPSPLRPRELCKQFPRVANMLADAWPHRREFEAQLNGLMLDDRGARQGFPLAVLRELADLRIHFDNLYGDPDIDAWQVHPE